MARHSFFQTVCKHCGTSFMARADTQGLYCSRKCGAMDRPKIDPIVRFWSKVKKTDACWEWTGNISSRGYGFFVPRHGLKVYAHRYCYQLTKTIPDKHFVCHHCDNKKCVRPDHLFTGTQKDNIQDAVRKQRMASGASHGSKTKPHRILRGAENRNSKLTDSKVQKIKRLAGSMSQQSIADNFGVWQTTVSSIIRGKTWTHIK